jgi:hypothetical protein
MRHKDQTVNDVYCKSHTEHTNVISRQNIEVWHVKAGGMCSNYLVLRVKTGCTYAILCTDFLNSMYTNSCSRSPFPYHSDLVYITIPPPPLTIVTYIAS